MKFPGKEKRMKLNKINLVEIEALGEKFPCVYDLNVQSEIQEEYGNMKKWINNLYPKSEEDINIKTLIFTMKVLVNEGIEVRNELGGGYREPISDTMAGMIITEIGREKMLEVVEELGNPNKENEVGEYIPSGAGDI